MISHDSPLRFKINGLIDTFRGEDTPHAIFRDCGSKEARDNTCRGNIWLPSSNQNRIFPNPPDIYEHSNNKNSSFFYEFVSSWTEKEPTENLDHYVQIVGKENIRLYLDGMLTDIQDPNQNHKVSWILPDKIKYRMNSSSDRAHIEVCEKLLALLNTAKNYPPAEHEIQSLFVVSFGIEKANYVDKYGKYDLLELPRNARDKNKEFIYEKEVRIVLNTSSFKNLSLHYCVSYLKLSCPGTSKFIEPYKKEELIIN